MSEPPSYPGSGDTPENPGGDYPPPPTHQSYGQPSHDQPQYGQPQYGQPQYGDQQPGQFGQQYGDWQGGNDAARSTDGVSITAFVLSLTCCLSLVGLILSFFGLKRTKNNQRKGRWAAVAAIPIGIIGTLILTAGIVGIVWYVGKVVTPDNAEVGQCVNVDEIDDDDDKETITLTKSDCGDKHDAQIMFVGTVGDVKDAMSDPSRAQFQNLGNADIERELCVAATDPDLVAKVDDSMRWNIASEDTTDPTDDVKMLCYVERGDGKKLTEKIG